MPTELTSKTLVDTTIKVLEAEETFLQQRAGNRSTLQYRECDVQFLLWRELVGQGYNAVLEEPYFGYPVDITVLGDSVPSLIELKGPWNDRAHTKSACIRAFKKDLTKHLGRLHLGEGKHYSLWILHGTESSIKTTFDSVIEKISPPKNECDLSYDYRSSVMRLNLNKQFEQVFAVEMRRHSTD